MKIGFQVFKILATLHPPGGAGVVYEEPGTEVRLATTSMSDRCSDLAFVAHDDINRLIQI